MPKISPSVVVVLMSSASFCLFSPLRMVFSSRPHPSKLRISSVLLPTSRAYTSTYTNPPYTSRIRLTELLSITRSRKHKEAGISYAEVSDFCGSVTFPRYCYISAVALHFCGSVTFPSGDKLDYNLISMKCCPHSLSSNSHESQRVKMC